MATFFNCSTAMLAATCAQGLLPLEEAVRMPEHPCDLGWA
jgi:hypothetical protein